MRIVGSVSNCFKKCLFVSPIGQGPIYLRVSFFFFFSLLLLAYAYTPVTWHFFQCLKFSISILVLIDSSLADITGIGERENSHGTEFHVKWHGILGYEIALICLSFTVRPHKHDLRRTLIFINIHVFIPLPTPQKKHDSNFVKQKVTY